MQEALQQAPQGGFLGSSGVQAGMGMASGGTGQMQAGTRSDTGMVRMGGYDTLHCIFIPLVGAVWSPLWARVWSVWEGVTPWITY